MRLKLSETSEELNMLNICLSVCLLLCLSVSAVLWGDHCPLAEAPLRSDGSRHVGLRGSCDLVLQAEGGCDGAAAVARHLPAAGWIQLNFYRFNFINPCLDNTNSRLVFINPSIRCFLPPPLQRAPAVCSISVVCGSAVVSGVYVSGRLSSWASCRCQSDWRTTSSTGSTTCTAGRAARRDDAGVRSS